MSRVRALILLFALLGNTAAAIAHAAGSSQQACCSGEICPVHKDRPGSQEKSHEDGRRGPDCLCGLDGSAANANAVGVAIAAHTAILQTQGVLPVPRKSDTLSLDFSTEIASGYALLLDQPPRSPGQRNF
jgi:hypothetical protein